MAAVKAQRGATRTQAYMPREVGELLERSSAVSLLTVFAATPRHPPAAARSIQFTDTSPRCTALARTVFCSTALQTSTSCPADVGAGVCACESCNKAAARQQKGVHELASAIVNVHADAAAVGSHQANSLVVLQDPTPPPQLWPLPLHLRCALRPHTRRVTQASLSAMTDRWWQRAIQSRREIPATAAAPAVPRARGPRMQTVIPRLGAAAHRPASVAWLPLVATANIARHVIHVIANVSAPPVGCKRSILTALPAHP
jgi:hypothetical protein